MNGPATNLLRWAPAFLTVWRARRESCGSWRPTPQVDRWYLDVLGVEPQRQGQGIGSARMQSSSSVAPPRRWALTQWPSNIKNIPLYKCHGFAVTEELPIPTADAVAHVAQPACSRRGQPVRKR